MSGASNFCVPAYRSSLKLSWNIWGEEAAFSFSSHQVWEFLSLTVKVQQIVMVQLHSWQLEAQILAKLETCVSSSKEVVRNMQESAPSWCCRNWKAQILAKLETCVSSSKEVVRSMQESAPSWCCRNWKAVEYLLGQSMIQQLYTDMGSWFYQEWANGLLWFDNLVSLIWALGFQNTRKGEKRK